MCTSSEIKYEFRKEIKGIRFDDNPVYFYFFTVASTFYILEVEVLVTNAVFTLFVLQEKIFLNVASE